MKFTRFINVPISTTNGTTPIKMLDKELVGTDAEIIAEARANRSVIDSYGIHILCDRLETANKIINDLRKENAGLPDWVKRAKYEIDTVLKFEKITNSVLRNKLQQLLSQVKE